MPESIDRETALWWAFILFGTGFIAGTIHGAYKMFRGQQHEVKKGKRDAER